MATKILILAAEFNELITNSLLAGASRRLSEESDITLKSLWVPGAFELPLAAAKAAESRNFDAIICLGAVIKGETPHFDFVAGQCASGIMKASLDSLVPIVFGVLTTNTVEEALNRAGLKQGNKGYEAASTALKMVKVLDELGAHKSGSDKRQGSLV